MSFDYGRGGRRGSPSARYTVVFGSYASGRGVVTLASMSHPRDVATVAWTVAPGSPAPGATPGLSDPAPYPLRIVGEMLRAGGHISEVARPFAGMHVERLVSAVIRDVPKIRAVQGFASQNGLERILRRLSRSDREDRARQNGAHQ